MLHSIETRKFCLQYHIVTIVVNEFQDHMRKAGDVCFAEVSRDADGTICNVCYH